MSKYILYRYQFSPIQSNVQSLFPVNVDKMVTTQHPYRKLLVNKA